MILRTCERSTASSSRTCTSGPEMCGPSASRRATSPSVHRAASASRWTMSAAEIHRLKQLKACSRGRSRAHRRVPVRLRELRPPLPRGQWPLHPRVSSTSSSPNRGAGLDWKKTDLNRVAQRMPRCASQSRPRRVDRDGSQKILDAEPRIRRLIARPSTRAPAASKRAAAASMTGTRSTTGPLAPVWERIASTRKPARTRPYAAGMLRLSCRFCFAVLTCQPGVLSAPQTPTCPPRYRRGRAPASINGLRTRSHDGPT